MGDADGLFESLTRLGLAYAVRTTPRGVPYAGFHWAPDPGHALCPFTAFAEEWTLRLTLHDLPAPLPTELQALVTTTRLPLGRVYVDVQAASAELALGVFVGGAGPSPSDLAGLLGYVYRARAHVVEGGPVPRRPIISHGAHPREAVDAELAARGSVTQGPEGSVTLVPVDGSPISFGVSVFDDGWLSVLARRAGVDAAPQGPAGLRTIQQLQRWTTAGRFTLDPAGSLTAAVETPWAEDPALSVSWSLDQARIMLDVADRHLGQAGA